MGHVDPSHIRNFSIIAHIDHGKSTLADRMLEVTGAVEMRDMRDQMLDSMDLEREKGITIKAQAVRMAFDAADGEHYELNLIDTPGHVDFTYEVSRALAACEGAILIVDATQGIQAQTLANVYLALDLNLKLIPIVNKIDLPSAEPERVAQELIDVIGFDPDEVLFASGKTGAGVPEILQAIVERVPPPAGNPDAPLRALVFDAKYDVFKGVLVYVRVLDGHADMSGRLRLIQQNARFEPVEIGYFRPGLQKSDRLDVGEVGYIATGLKGVAQSRVGDTVTTDLHGAEEALPGYRPAKAMVFAGIYPTDPDSYDDLRDALERLTLNDAALQWQPESSAALGFGFRCGFLGLLHMEIIQERLEREFDLDLIATAPSVQYEVQRTNGQTILIDSPAELPSSTEIDEIREPWVKVTITAPARYLGTLMTLVSERRGEFEHVEYFDHAVEEGDSRILATFHLPLSEIVPTEDAPSQGRKLAAALKVLIPRQLFDVPIQAAIGGHIIARETVKALRKNVLAKCYGGDISRKRKLLEKQKAGKKRMKMVGSVEVPQEAFMAVLKMRE